MIIYLIEDNQLKAKHIFDFIKARFPEFVVEIFGSFQSGLRAIESRAPDLILLDMTIPTFDRQPNGREGRMRPIGGYDLMRKMRLRKISTAVVVVTQLESFGEGAEEVSFSEITSICEKEFNDFFKGSVYFGQDDEAWQDVLDSIISELIKND